MSTSNGAASTSAEKAERNAMLFRRAEIQQASADDNDDNFFDVTPDDVRKMHAHLQEQVRLHTQRALVPAAYVALKNKERKIESYAHTIVRFTLPNGMLIQAQFSSLEPASNIYEFVRQLLRNHNAAFSLRLPPNEQVPSSRDKDLIDAGIAPKSLVMLKLPSFSGDIEGTFDVAQLTECTEQEADAAAKEWLSVNSVFRPFNPLIPEENQTQKRAADEPGQPPAQRQKPTSSGAPVPKWLRH